MPERTKPSLIELADAAFRQAYAKVVRRAQQAGTPIIVWDNGRVRAMPPDELEEEQVEKRAAPARPDPS